MLQLLPASSNVPDTGLYGYCGPRARNQFGRVANAVEVTSFLLHWSKLKMLRSVHRKFCETFRIVADTQMYVAHKHDEDERMELDAHATDEAEND